MNRKPPKGGFDKGLVAPEWEWFWENLLLILPMWEGGGTPRNLVPGGEQVLSINGSTAWTTGAVGPGFVFDGVDDFILLPNLQDGLSKLTTTVVLKPATISSANDTFLDTYRSTVPSQNLLQRNDLGEYQGFIANESATLFGGAFGLTFTVNKTSVATTVMDFGGEMAGWLDGVKGGTTYSPTGVIKTTNQGLSIGGREDTTSNPSWEGDIYAVYIHNSILSPAQIKQLARDPFGPFRMAEDEGSLFVGVTIVELAATIAAAGSLTTTLSVTRSLNSVIAATGSLTSALQLINGLYAALASTGAIAANLDNQSGLYSAIAGLSSVFGGASVARDIAAVISAVSAYQASMDSQSGLYASVDATSTINAKINNLRDLDSLIASVSTVSGKIGCIVNIDGTILSTSTVAGAVSLIRSLDSLLPATSTIAGELSRMISLAVVIPSVSTIVADLLIIIGEKRGFISLDNVEQSHISHNNVSQYHVSKSDVSQYHVGLANEFN